MTDDLIPFTAEHTVYHLREEARAVVDRGIVTRGQRLVMADLLLKAADEIERLQVEAATWRAVAVALVSELVEDGYDPNSTAVQAYNHARNGRYAIAATWVSGDQP